MKTTELSYGSIKLYKGVCTVCGESYFGKPCCASQIEVARRERRSLAKGKRTFSKGAIRRALEIQDGKCYWCERHIKSHLYYTRQNTVAPLFVCGDHLIPHAFEENSNDSNLVASCNICNVIKSSKMFKSPDETRAYILSKLDKYLVE